MRPERPKEKNTACACASSGWVCGTEYGTIRRMRTLLKALGRMGVFLAGLAMAGCTGVPRGVVPVTGFDAGRYLGKWYEIGRLDHSFERGLNNVTAEYGLRADGLISVNNRGYDSVKHVWREASGRARFLGASTTGSLGVSFFGPFYAGYHVAVLDSKGYQYAVISGNTPSYFWILGREPQMDETLYNELLARGATWGVATGQVIRVYHDVPPPP